MKKISLFVAALCATAALNAGVVTVEPGNGNIEAALATFTEGDTLLLSTGVYTEPTYQLTFDKTITLLAAEGATPEVSLYEAKMSADFAAEGLSLTNHGKDNRLIRMGAEVNNISFKNCSFNYDGASYTIYLSSHVGSISIEDCSFIHKGASHAIFLNSEADNILIKNSSFNYQGEAQTISFDEGTTVGSLTIDGCLFTTGNATSQKDFVLEARYTAMTDFTLTNSTVMNAGIEGSERAFYCIPTNALVDHCTFYNCGVHNVYISGENLTTCQVKNCISVSPIELNDYCIKTYAGTVENCLYYNLDGPRSSDAEILNCINADPLFVDAANGDLSLQAGSPAIGAATDGSNLGDPRWVAKEPVDEYITENFLLDWEKAEGIDASAVDVNDGILTIKANAGGWAAGGATVDFGGKVLGADLAGVKGAFKCAATTESIEIYPYVIDATGARWFEKNWSAKNCADWTEFTIVPNQSLWDDQPAEALQTADIVKFGFIGVCGNGLTDYEIQLKDIEILVGEQPAGLPYTSTPLLPYSQKHLRNGQILIEHNGVRYNVLGAQF